MKLRVLLCLALIGATATASAPLAALESRRVHEGGVDYAVVEIDLARERLDLVWKPAPDAPAFASVEALRSWSSAQGRELLFATNAGIYDTGFRPLGLHVEDGVVLRRLNTVRGDGRRGNFSMQPNGVFHVDASGRAGVVATAEWASAGVDARIASQSGPMLVVDGAINPLFQSSSTSRRLRSGVCAPSPRRVVFAISEAPVNFDAIARVFRDQLGCRDALYLDGTLSRLWTRADGYMPASSVTKPYVGMFAVFAPARDESSR